MRTKILSVLVAAFTVLAVQAQSIAVVQGSSMQTCFTLKQAVDKATDGSIIYLPAGGFQIGDTVRIKNRVSIIGLNHRPKSDNADGMTTISGNLYFDGGSSGSIVMGCFLSGSVMIGYDDASVNNIFVRYCNVYSVSVKDPRCTGTTINQSYIRTTCGFNSAPAIITNNVMNGTSGLNGGLVDHNVVVYGTIGADNTTVSNNVFMSGSYSGSNCLTDNNMRLNSTAGDNSVKLEAVSWSDVFENPGPGISSNASYHFKQDYKFYERSVGIYGGTGFHDDALPPVPYLKAKVIPESTDYEGKLKVNLTVKDGSK